MSAELEFLQGDTPGRKVPLSTNELTIGRDASANLVLSHPSISRQHAKVFCQGDTWHVVDLNSSNGTLLNGSRIYSSPIALNSGDQIAMGAVVLRFQDAAASTQTTQAWTPQPQAAHTPQLSNTLRCSSRLTLVCMGR